MTSNVRNIGTGLEILDMVLDSAQLIQIVPKLYNRYVKGEQSTEDKQKELIQMIQAGKSQEALEETINSWTTGLSDDDEMRLLRDVCHLVTGSQITAEEGYKFFAFLDSCDTELRGRFREAYISDKDPIMRWGVIVVMAKLPNDDQRHTFLSGTGLMDPTLIQQLIDVLKTPINAAGDWVRERLPELEYNHAVRHLNKLLLASQLPKQPAPGGWGAAFKAMIKFEI